MSQNFRPKPSFLNIFQKFLQKWTQRTLFTLFWYPKKYCIRSQRLPLHRYSPYLVSFGMKVNIYHCIIIDKYLWIMFYYNDRVSKKLIPILYIKLLYKMGYYYFLDRQYVTRSSYLLCIVSYYMKWVTTSWTGSIFFPSSSPPSSWELCSTFCVNVFPPLVWSYCMRTSWVQLYVLRNSLNN